MTLGLNLNRLLLLMITLFSFHHCLGYPGEFSLTKFLDGGQKCDVQLFLGGSEHFLFSPSYEYPTTIIYTPAFLHDFRRWHRFPEPGQVANFTLNTLQLRIGQCRTSLFFSYMGHIDHGVNWFAATNQHSLRFNQEYVDSREITLILIGSSKALGQSYNFSLVN
ncbi:hypothetical protein Fcan01_25865 [Folsomia candida]|uniref:Uncharacterized protein n=1 Tax=Folsomia candida TaxID=158441 RepID=A0A226D135_FOLCA|nr:hypothetical protein Fcan01_25865 [Folsomia candida]